MKERSLEHRREEFVQQRAISHIAKAFRQIPTELRAWGCDEELWRLVKNKNQLRRLARDGDEAHGRRRIAALRRTLLGDAASG